MKRSKLLISLFRFPYPATDGTRYKILNNVIEGLSKDFDLEFFIVTMDQYTEGDIAYLEENYGKVHVFNHSRLACAARSISALWLGLPLQARIFVFQDAKVWLKGNLARFDAFYVHEIRMTEYFRSLPKEIREKIVVDFNDAISLHYRGSLTKLNIFKKLFYVFEGSRVAHYESLILKSFYFFNIVSEFDKEYLLKNAKIEIQPGRFTVIHHGTLIDSRTVPLDKKSLFFMGNLDYRPNRDALNFFLETIWPHIVSCMPHIQFFIAGKGKKIASYEHHKNIHFVGFVPDIFTVMSQCSLMVVPIRFGGGAPSKIIESMSYGLPVLATQIGVRGIIGAKDGENMYIAPETDIEKWLSIIKENDENTDLRKMIGENGRRLVIEKYSASSSQESFRILFHQIISSK